MSHHEVLEELDSVHFFLVHFDWLKKYGGIYRMFYNLFVQFSVHFQFVQRLAFHRYGKAPDIRLSGHVGSTFPYITLPLGIYY
jgi:hypothetical protein